MRCSFLLLTLAGTLACARREPAAQPARGDSTTVAAIAAAPPSRATPPSSPVMRAAPEPADAKRHAFVGTWDLAPPTDLRSPSLSIAMDSVRGTTVHGRIVRALSGDIELGPDAFKPFRGSLDASGNFHARIEANERGAPVTEVAARVTGDSWTGTSLVWGGSELVGGDRTFTARKGK